VQGELVAADQEEIARLRQKNAVFQALATLFEDFIHLAGATDRPEVIHGLLQKVVEVSAELTGAEHGSLFLLDRSGMVIDSLLARGNLSPGQVSTLVSTVLDKGLAGWVRRHGQIGLVADTATDERWLTLPDQPFEARSALAVPIISGERILAILTLMHSRPGHFSSDAAELMRLTAGQMALVLENANLFSRLNQSLASLSRAKHEIEIYSKALDKELEKGRQIQKDFLPSRLPALSQWQIEAFFHPARQVAGDFYDVFALPGGYIGLVMADVCDKGVGSALFMALFRSLIRVFSGQAQLSRTAIDVEKQAVGGEASASPARPSDHHLDALRTIALTNDYIAQEHDRMCMFATVFFGVLDPRNGSLYYINGGHEPVYHIGRQGIRATFTPTGPAVGLAPKMTFTYKQVQMAPGEILFAYTDGVTEARSPEGELFSKNRLTRLISPPTTNARELLEQVRKALFSHIGKAPQDDDITLLVIQRMAAKEPDGRSAR
jgi:sigma-B regulation protein RsbU (phosphoserine phosphatase)